MKVWVTREEAVDGPLSTALRSAGLDVVLEPVLQRRVVCDAAADISRLGPEDWLVLTSVYAVEVVAGEPATIPRVAVVGESSRRAARARGFRVELISADGRGKSLLEAVREKATKGKVCYPRSSLVTPPPSWAGVELLSPVLYETAFRSFDPGVAKRVDVVCVASPSAVDALINGGVDLCTLRLATIGPTTSTALRKNGTEPWVQAPRRTFDALAAAIVDRCKEPGSPYNDPIDSQ